MVMKLQIIPYDDINNSQSTPGFRVYG